MVNLADSSSEWCLPILRNPFALTTLVRLVASYEAVSLAEAAELDREHVEAEANKLDIMCLALALLTSLVQETKEARVQLSKISEFPRSIHAIGLAQQNPQNWTPNVI